MKSEQEHGCCGCSAPDPEQRRKLGAMLAVALAPLVPATALAQSNNKPQPGHKLSIAQGDKAGKQLQLADLKVGEDPVLAYPMDASGKVLESRISLLTVLRLAPADIGDAIKPHAPEGVVAYSAVCTHAGCPVTKVKDTAKSVLICPCHGSEFDAGQRGTVVHGPAMRRLAMVPLKIEDKQLVVAGVFDGPLGPPVS